MTGLELVAAVDEQPDFPSVHLRPAERVVELVHGEEGRDAESADLVQAGVDLGAVALRCAEKLSTVEEV